MSGYATENINVYSDKSSGSQSVGSIKSGESVTVTDNSDCDWAKVQLSDGISGYVNQDLFIVELKNMKRLSFTPEETPNINSQITSNMYAGDFVLLENSVTLKEGETYLISPTLSTNYGASGLMYYNSSDNDVASVSSVGRITANSEGQAVITVTSPFSEKSQSMSITVEKTKAIRSLLLSLLRKPQNPEAQAEILKYWKQRFPYMLGKAIRLRFSVIQI